VPPVDLARVQVVSWDVDGTLYALPRLRLAIAVRALARAATGGLRGDLDELRRLARWRELMERVRAAGGDLRTAGDAASVGERDAIRALERRWYGDAIRRVGVRAGVRPLYRALAARGVRQVVLSDYDAEYKLAALGLAGAFAAVYSGESLGWLKPSTELYRRVTAAEGVAPQAWLHIGDRVDRDVVPARAIGCQAMILGER
jgi:FMN phosphatase YigB (HAD superfamily)